jgi:hypothetical protein
MALALLLCLSVVAGALGFFIVHKVQFIPVAGFENRLPSEGLLMPPSKGCSSDWTGEYKNSQATIAFHDPLTDLGLTFETVEFEAADSRKLRGWWIPPVADASKTDGVAMVCVHGSGRDRRGWLRHAEEFTAAGYAVLLFDCRGHGISDGKGERETTPGWCGADTGGGGGAKRL